VLLGSSPVTANSAIIFYTALVLYLYYAIILLRFCLGFVKDVLKILAKKRKLKDILLASIFLIVGIKHLKTTNTPRKSRC
jgi:hypothetical protein